MILALTKAFAAYFVLTAFPIDDTALQGDVVVRGTVLNYDADGTADAGTAVYAISKAGIYRTTADTAGHFFFLSLLPGNYQFTVSNPLVYHGVKWHRPWLEFIQTSPRELDAGFEYEATVWSGDPNPRPLIH